MGSARCFIAVSTNYLHSRYFLEMIVNFVAWFIRLLKYYGTESVCLLISIGIAIFLYIGFDDRTEKGKKRKETQELIDSAQRRVHAYKLGVEQRKRQENMRKRNIR